MSVYRHVIGNFVVFTLARIAAAHDCPQHWMEWNHSYALTPITNAQEGCSPMVSEIGHSNDRPKLRGEEHLRGSACHGRRKSFLDLLHQWRREWMCLLWRYVTGTGQCKWKWSDNRMTGHSALVASLLTTPSWRSMMVTGEEYVYSVTWSRKSRFWMSDSVTWPASRCCSRSINVISNSGRTVDQINNATSTQVYHESFLIMKICIF